jgi:hypothetical protein
LKFAPGPLAQGNIVPIGNRRYIARNQFLQAALLVSLIQHVLNVGDGGGFLLFAAQIQPIKHRFFPPDRGKMRLRVLRF